MLQMLSYVWCCDVFYVCVFLKPDSKNERQKQKCKMVMYMDINMMNVTQLSELICESMKQKASTSVFFPFI